MARMAADGRSAGWDRCLDASRRVAVDFDETLLLVNSTHAYLDSAHPSLAAYAITRGVDRSFALLAPNRPHIVWIYRDWLRVLLVTILLPWTWFLWRFHYAGKAARRWTNRRLLAAIDGRSADLVAVISNGFSPIVRPVMREMGVDAPLVAGSLLRGYRIRARGKLSAWKEKLPTLDPATTAFITDSTDDEKLLAACGSGGLVKWHEEPIQPFRNVYIPFLYTERVKRRNRRYVWRGVVMQDLVAVLIAFAFIPARSHFLIPGIAALQFSLWLVYEFGYFDNDRRAGSEREGHVPETFARHSGRMRPRSACLIIGGCAILGAVLFSMGRPEVALEPGSVAVAAGLALCLWLPFLGAVYLLFRLYNRTDEKLRIFIYPALQIVRLSGLALLLPLSLVGKAIIAAFVVGRSVPYIVYRASGVRWGDYNRLLVLLFFLVDILLLVSARDAYDLDRIFAIQFGLALIWLVARSRVEILRIWKRRAGRLSHPQPRRRTSRADKPRRNAG